VCLWSSFFICSVCYILCFFRFGLCFLSFFVYRVFLVWFFFFYDRLSSVWPRVAAFFSKACLFRQAFFVICAAQFGLASGRRLFFRNPSLKSEGFFVFYRFGAVRLGLGSLPFF